MTVVEFLQFVSDCNNCHNSGNALALFCEVP